MLDVVGVFGAKNRMKFIEWKMNEREKNRSNGFGLAAEKERRPHWKKVTQSEIRRRKAKNEMKKKTETY